MPLLEAQDKTPHVKEDFKLPVPVMDDLKLYAKMTDSILTTLLCRLCNMCLPRTRSLRNGSGRIRVPTVEEITC
jgi:hypothetical protein